MCIRDRDSRRPAQPRLREQFYESRILPNYTKNEEALLELICNLYLVGVSTRKVETGLRSILGKYGISAGSVSKITERIIPEIEFFHKRDIEDNYIYLYLDGVTFSAIGNDNKKKKYIFLPTRLSQGCFSSFILIIGLFYLLNYIWVL